jgi:GAF domain-containing protein
MADIMPERNTSAAPVIRRLLDLLAQDAPAEEFGALAAEARRSGADPQDLAEVERATATALQVRHSLRKHRRRETELAALFDTAGDLAALRDLDAVLHSIVRRARMLLGTDTAYLTLPDEAAGDTYMRVTDGSVSALFQGLRLDLGEGLGGLVAQTARPYSSPDYRSDQRFHHTGTIDNGVLDEGLVAILGVPLLLGSHTGAGGGAGAGAGAGRGKVIGVLFAADRSPRSFSPDEVALLCSLAAHAAIAIDTARALTDLAEANALIREHAAAMQRAEEAHDKLTDLVLRGGDVTQVAAATARLLNGTVTVHDHEGRPLTAVHETGTMTGTPTGSTGPTPGADRIGGSGADDGTALLASAADSRDAARAVLRDGRWICAVLAGSELLGCLVLHDRPTLEDSDRRLLERASVVTALLLLLRRSVAETENRVRGELITDLLTDPQRDPAGLAERGRRLGIDLNRPRLVLVAEAVPAARERLAGAAARYLFAGGSITAEHAGATVLLLPDDGEEPGRTARNAAARLGQLLGAPVTVAASGPANGVPALAAAHAEAVRCLRALHVLGRTGDGADAADLGFLGVLLGNGQDVDGFVGRTLGPLLDYDARRGTELVRTLDAWFGCGGSQIRARDALHVHVNTVVQRLDRIESLLGPDWNTPARALELQLALQLHRLTPNAE